MEPRISETITSQDQVPEPTGNATSGIRVLSILVGLLLVALFSSLFALGAIPRIQSNQIISARKTKQLEKTPSVSFVEAQAVPSIQQIRLPGAAEAILDAKVYARVDGYLKSRYVNIGQTVKKGQLLAEIDTPELDKQVLSARSNVNQAEAQLLAAREALIKAQTDEHTAASNVQKARTDLKFAGVQYERYKGLVKEGAVSREAGDSRETDYNGARATLQSALSQQKSASASIKQSEAAIEVAKAAVETARSQLSQYLATQEFKRVKAPFSGTVIHRNVDPGALITSGSDSNNSTLFEIANTDTLRVFVYVPEQHVSSIKVGQDALLAFQAFPSEKFKGKVTYIAGGLDPRSKTLQVEIHLLNPTHRLMPGMYAQVSFQTNVKELVALVPGSAIQSRAEGTLVYVVDDKNLVHLKKVEIRRDLGDQVEITSGIDIGDRVVISPSYEIQDGVSVDPVQLKRKPSTESKES